MERPKPVNVEKIFGEFVATVGGQIVSDLLPKGYDKPNADYFFSKQEIIAELKCIQTDHFSDTGKDFERYIKLFEGWLTKGYIKEEDGYKTALGVLPLPQEAKMELIKVVRKTIDNAIHKANKQIACTKKEFNKPNAKGLLFIAIDGSYLLNPLGMMTVVFDLMATKYSGQDSEIDGCIYFTMNQTAQFIGDDLDRYLWIPAYRELGTEPSALSNFVDEIGKEFQYKYLPKVQNFTPIENISIDRSQPGAFQNISEMMNSLRNVPKKYIFKKG